MSDLTDLRHWLDMIARHADLPLESLSLDEGPHPSGTLYRLMVNDEGNIRLPLGPAWRAREAMGHILMVLYNITKERQETASALNSWLTRVWGTASDSDELRAIYLAIDERRKSLMLGPVT